MRRSRFKSKECHRSGVAAVEAAIAIPFFLFLIVATVDCCHSIFLKQSLTVAAYEGARVAIIPGATPGNITKQCQQILSERKVKGASVSIHPSNLSNLTFGDFVTVKVTAPAKGNRLFSSGWFSSTKSEASVTFMIEE